MTKHGNLPKFFFAICKFDTAKIPAIQYTFRASRVSTLQLFVYKGFVDSSFQS